MNTEVKARNMRPKKKQYFDYYFLFAIILLNIFGLIMIYSAGFYSEDGPELLLRKQFMISLFALVIAIVTMSIFKLRTLSKLSVFILIACAILLLILLTPIGIELNGARRWIDFKYITIQPSEFAKLGVILYEAMILSRFRKYVTDMKVILLVFVPVLVIFCEIFFISNNLSSALIVLFIAVAMYFMVHPKWKMFAIFCAVAVCMVVIVILVLDSIDVSGLDSTQMSHFRGRRFLAWRHPEYYENSTSRQTLNTLYAIGAGGLFGKGLGASVQKAVIPYVYNDMILAVVCEELGFLGVLTLILLYAFVFYKIAYIAYNSRSAFGSMVCIGVFCHLAIQIILNLCVATNLLPNTGIPLPFVSYGGSAILVLIIEMGLVIKTSRSIPVIIDE